MNKNQKASCTLGQGVKHGKLEGRIMRSLSIFMFHLLFPYYTLKMSSINVKRWTS